MGWATNQEVLKHHRMLSEGEAAFRQVFLSLTVAFFLTLVYLLSGYVSFLLSVPSLIFVLYEIIDTLFPSSAHPHLTCDELLGRRPPPQTTEAVAQDPPAAVAPQEPTSEKQAEEKTPKDEPIYRHKFSDNRSLMDKISSSSQAAASVNLLIAAALSYALVVAIFSLSRLWVLGLLMVINFETAHALCSSAVESIEEKEIDPYTRDFSEKLMLRFTKSFAPARGWYLIGELDGKRVGLSRMDRFLHTLIGGPTGALKSSSTIIPQIMHDADSKGSVVVPDRKDPDLTNWVAGRWLKKGKKVFIFAPWNQANTIGINPLYKATDQDLLDVTEVLMHEYEEMIEKVQSFFQSRTKYLVYAILKLVTSFKDEYANLSTAFRIVQSHTVISHFINSADPQVGALFTDFKRMNSQEQVNALTSIKERLEIFMDGDVRKAFSRSEFNLKMLFQKEPCLLIIGAPMNKQDPGRMICSFIINLIIKKAFEERSLYKTESAEKEAPAPSKNGDGKKDNSEDKKALPPNDLYLYLDELRALKVTRLADLVSIARDTKTHVIGSVTDLNMLRYYGTGDFSSLLSNFRTQIWMGGMDIESCKYVSDSLGKDKVADVRVMRDYTLAGAKEEPLLSPDKVKNLKDEEMIVISPLVRPFVAKKASIYTSKWLRKLHVPGPAKMRELYKKWGFAEADLIDPVLPIAQGLYDVAEMKSGKEIVVDPNITVETFHKEPEGGIYNAEHSKSTFEPESTQSSLRSDEPPDNDDGLDAAALI